MTPQMQQTLFVQNPRPTLQEALDFVDNQVMVENMTIKPGSKKADTVHSIEETEKPKSINCWICNGNHRRDMCTADKSSLRCEKCGLSGHVTEACRGGRRQTRSPSRSRWSGRSPSSSANLHLHPPRKGGETRKRRRRKRGNQERRRKTRVLRGNALHQPLPLPPAADPPHAETDTELAGHPSSRKRSATL